MTDRQFHSLLLLDTMTAHSIASKCWEQWPNLSQWMDHISGIWCQTWWSTNQTNQIKCIFESTFLGNILKITFLHVAFFSTPCTSHRQIKCNYRSTTPTTQVKLKSSTAIFTPNLQLMLTSNHEITMYFQHPPQFTANAYFTSWDHNVISP